MADPGFDESRVLDTLRRELSSLRIVELKRVLEQLSLSRSGNKGALVERVVHNVQVYHRYVSVRYCSCVGLVCDDMRAAIHPD